MDMMTTMLLVNVGLPLALKLINGGKDSAEAAKIAEIAVSGLSGEDVVKKIATATPEQNAEIVDGLYRILCGVGGAFGNLIDSLGKLGKK